MKTFSMRRLLVLLMSLGLLLAACGGGGESEDSGGSSEAAAGGGSEAAEAEPEEDVERGTVIVGSTNFTEQEIVAEMYAQVLEDAGYTVERRFQLGSREVVYPAIESGEIDLMAEYLNTLLLFVTGGETEGTDDTTETADALESELPDELTLLEPAEAQDKNALAVTSATADELGLSAVSDLEGQASDLVLGGPPECPQRPLCLPGYEETYGLEFQEFRALDAGGPLTTEALNSGQIDVGLVFSTQSAIETNDWVTLEDDKGLQAAENITPLVRTDVVNDEVTELLNGVSAALTTEKVIELNTSVDADGESPAAVAETFLNDEGLLGGASDSSS